jgi:hypothetical protein
MEVNDLLLRSVAMLDASSSSQRHPIHAAAGPQLIAIGLAILIVATWIPSLPVLTAMAVLALGTTYATLVRFRYSPLLAPVLVIHAATYATLYALFVGALFHASARAASPQFSLVDALDLFLSWLFLVVAARRIWTALRPA